MENIYLKNILKEIEQTFKKIPDSSVIEMIDFLAGFERIFITGAGRSGLLMKTFAIRLMQMGFKVYVPGEVITPAIKNGDLLLIGSGSGETESLKIFSAVKGSKRYLMWNALKAVLEKGNFSFL